LFLIKVQPVFGDPLLSYLVFPLPEASRQMLLLTTHFISRFLRRPAEGSITSFVSARHLHKQFFMVQPVFGDPLQAIWFFRFLRRPAKGSITAFVSARRLHKQFQLIVFLLCFRCPRRRQLGRPKGG
jgi:hypothetical protein